jgi:uncharacterized protein
VRGYLHIPEVASGDGLVLSHGAGSNCNSPLLVAVAGALAERGLTVVRCDLPYRQLKPHGPPIPGSAVRDREGLRAAATYLRDHAPGSILIGGHSYGGRQASMIAAEDPSVADGLLLLSYPLHPPRRQDQPRTAHFPKLRTRSLFIHGTRDAFGTAEELREALGLIPAETRLIELGGAGHELVRRGHEDEAAGKIAAEFSAFFRSDADGRIVPE